MEPILSVKDLSVSFQAFAGTVHAVRDVNFDLMKGETLAIVGESGSGKSTIASLVMGRNRNYRGNIYMGGKALADISEKSLMEHITMVRHNSYLFKGTVEENLRMGNPKAGKAQMEEVLRKVNLWDFLQQQEGLETLLLEKGSNFSGGQCQRLCIARALLHETPCISLMRRPPTLMWRAKKLLWKSSGNWQRQGRYC